MDIGLASSFPSRLYWYALGVAQKIADGELTERSSMVLLGSDGLITTILGVEGIGILAVFVSLFVKLCNTNGG